MKNILIVVLVLVVSGALFGYYQYNRKPAGVADQEAIKINAAALVATFMKDEKAAQTSYNNKVLEVVGKVFAGVNELLVIVGKVAVVVLLILFIN